MEYVRLEKLVELKQGLAINSHTNYLVSDHETKLALLRIADMPSKRKVVFMDEDTPDRYIADEDDIIYTRTGQVGLVFTGQNGVVHNNCFRVIPIDEQTLSRKYLFWALSLPEVYYMANIYAAGAAQPDLPHSSFKKIKIPICSLNNQKRIVSILSAYDNLIENNNKRIRLLEQMAENLYKEWFVRFRFPGHEKAEFENGLPKSWKVEKVKSIVKRLPFNRTYKEYELEKEGAVIVIDQSTDDYLGYHNNEPSHYANYDDPLLLFGDHSCKFQLMTRNFSLGENVIPFTTNNKSLINEYWLFYASHKLIQTEEYKRHWGRFVSIKVLVPDINIQLRFENIVKTFEKEKNQLITKNSILSRQRDLLLPRLMSGKLEVKV